MIMVGIMVASWLVYFDFNFNFNHRNDILHVFECILGAPFFPLPLSSMICKRKMDSYVSMYILVHTCDIKFSMFSLPRFYTKER